MIFFIRKFILDYVSFFIKIKLSYKSNFVNKIQLKMTKSMYNDNTIIIIFIAKTYIKDKK